MEYFDLGDLSKHMEAPMRETDACDIVFQILEGLWFMHSNGYAHRDLKPNVSLLPLSYESLRATYC